MRSVHDLLGVHMDRHTRLWVCSFRSTHPKNDVSAFLLFLDSARRGDTTGLNFLVKVFLAGFYSSSTEGIIVESNVCNAISSLLPKVIS